MFSMRGPETSGTAAPTGRHFPHNGHMTYNDPMPADANSAAYVRQRHRITLALSEFTLPLMLDVYQRFDGDVVAAIVLGEIGVRNVGGWLGPEHNDARALEDHERHGAVMRSCNTLSIADSTGIPRETVRRKVATLIDKGWVYRDSRGHLFVHTGVAHRFDAMNDATQQQLRKTAQRIEALLLDDADAATASIPGRP